MTAVLGPARPMRQVAPLWAHLARVVADIEGRLNARLAAELQSRVENEDDRQGAHPAAVEEASAGGLQPPA